jgi:hypothetical protein
MTLEELFTKVQEWDLQLPASNEGGVAEFSAIYDELNYHASHDWKVYLPADHPDYNTSYMERLAVWIGNVSDRQDQQLLLRYARLISFFSHADFRALYHAALNREVSRWVAEEIKATLVGQDLVHFNAQVFGQVLRQTWYCPVTDSLDINEFYKVNNIAGAGHRPAFRTLYMLAQKAGKPNSQLSENILHYMEHHQPSLERLVLLEDLVGSGSQSINAVSWAAASLGKPVLFVPLIMCPKAAEPLREAEMRSSGMLTVRPIIELINADIVGPERAKGTGWRIADALEDFAERQKTSVLKNLSPFGFDDTGCSLATFSNTPDNTLPIVHHKPHTGGWNPLFPRIDRE